jgi:hypothetical protein
VGVVSKWVVGVFSLAGLTYGIIVAINEEKSKHLYNKTHYKCVYKTGMCNTKPTWKNCSGGLLDSECEKELNNE